MIKYILSLLLLCFTLCNFAQLKISSYLDKNWEDTEDKDKAHYYRITKKLADNHYEAKVYSIKDSLLREIIQYSNLETKVKDGNYVYYDKNGIKKRQGTFQNGERVKRWTKWYDNGKDSSIVEYAEDNMYRNIRIAATDKTVNLRLDTLYLIEQMPGFPGGTNALMKFIKKNLIYPNEAIQKNVKATCHVGFVIEKDGSVTGVKLFRAIENCDSCNLEALRVIKMLPTWSPGLQNGIPVRVQFNLPIKFGVTTGKPVERKKKKRKKRK